MVLQCMKLTQRSNQSAFSWSKQGNPPDRLEPVVKSEEIFRPRDIQITWIPIEMTRFRL